MLYETTIDEITKNVNPGVEYEIALFYNLLVQTNFEESRLVLDAIRNRADYKKIDSLIHSMDLMPIDVIEEGRGWELCDASFETQNDNVGPADIVLYFYDSCHKVTPIGLSVKYKNTCTLNITGRNFISSEQEASLRSLLPQYTKKYIEEMTSIYGDVSNWFRKRKKSKTTDEFIDKIRDAVIANWPSVQNKKKLLQSLYHSDSPIEFWVATFDEKRFTLETDPIKIEGNRANDVIVKKMETSYIAFFLDRERIGHMQVKFNNGFLERCKKQNPDIIYQGVKMSYGNPFSSWNFSVEK